jgi:fructokinase
MRIGVDLGGTKIEAIALDEHGAEIGRRRVATPTGRYDLTIAAIAALVEEIERLAGRRGTVGVGVPGAIAPGSNVIKNANSVCLNGRPLGDDLSARLARPVRLANDANCFALSEAVDGAGAGAHLVFAAIVGTGTGGGIAIDGSVWTGPNAIAGEWGHNPLPWPEADEWPGPACYCGKTGCIETFLSGPGLSLAYEKASGARAGSPEIVRRRGEGDPVSSRVLEQYESRMARALAHVVNILDPDIIVLGGGMSLIDSVYDRVPVLWKPFVFSDRVVTRLVKAKHGDASGVRGAAWLWPVP